MGCKRAAVLWESSKLCSLHWYPEAARQNHGSWFARWWTVSGLFVFNSFRRHYTGCRLRRVTNAKETARHQSVLVVTKLFNIAINYRPWGSCRKVMFSQACVKNSVHRGEGCIPAWTGADTHPPLSPPPPTATAAGGMHPTGMHSCYFDAKKSDRYSQVLVVTELVVSGTQCISRLLQTFSVSMFFH